MKIVEKSIKIEPWGFLETKVNFLFPNGAQMEPHGAKLELKLSSKLMKIGLKLNSQMQLKFEDIFYESFDYFSLNFWWFFNLKL